MADPIPITSPSSIRSPSRSSRTNFLIIYNILSAGLWTVVLGRVVLLYLLRGPWKVYFGVGDFTKWTQTLAVSEILFSLTGESFLSVCLFIYNSDDWNRTRPLSTHHYASPSLFSPLSRLARR